MSKELKIAGDQELDHNLKNVKVNGTSSALDLSRESVKTKDLTVDGKLTVNGAVEGSLRTEDDMSIDFGGDELFFINKGERVVTFKHISETIPSFIVHGANGSAVDFFSLLCSSNGATTISTEDADGVEADLNVNPDGYLKLTSAAGEDITLDVGASGEILIKENTGTYTPTADNHVATKKYVDDNAGGTDTAYSTYQAMNWRMSSVNNYYTGNQTLGTSVTAGDFGVGELKYSIFNSYEAVTLQRVRINYYVSSTEPYEFELWDVTVPSDGSTSASTAVKIGDTLETSGDVSANRYYSITSGGLSYSLSASHQVFLLCRYTDGSGTKTANASVTLGMTI